MNNGTVLDIEELIKMIGSLYIENTVLRANNELLKQQLGEKDNEKKS